MANERATVLNYHTPRPSSRIDRWLRNLPRPSWITIISLFFTAAAACWLYANSPPWIVVRRFYGVLPWKSLPQWAVSADGTRLLAVLADHKTIRVYEIATGKTVCDLRRPTDEVSVAEFSPDGSRVWCIRGGSGPAELWSVPGGQLLASRLPPLPSFGFDWLGLNSASSFSPNGRWIATMQMNELLILDGHTGALVTKLPIACFASFSPNNHYLAALSGAPRLVHIWDTKTWQQVTSFPVGSGDGIGGGDGFCIASSPNGQSLVACYHTKQAQLWDAATNRVSTTFTATGVILGCCYSPDGHHLVIHDTGDQSESWDMATRQAVGALADSGELPAISPDGSRAVTRTGIFDFPSFSRLGYFDAGNQVAWIPGRQAFVSGELAGVPFISMFQRRRPEAIYGLLWLPQFWIMLLAASISAWLITRDLRDWRRRPPML